MILLRKSMARAPMKQEKEMKEATEKVFQDFLDRSLEAGRHLRAPRPVIGGPPKAEALRRDVGR